MAVAASKVSLLKMQTRLIIRSFEAVSYIADFSSPPLPDNVFEGDIELTKEQQEYIKSYGDARSNNSRAAGSDNRLWWTNGIIPYEIDCSLSK